MKPHDIRIKLLENGYAPLPLTGKKCFLEGWSDGPITAERVESWRRQHSPNAGIRCDNLAVIDLDITDEALLDDVFEMVIDRLGGEPLERIGNPPKTALVYRLDEDGVKMRTGKYSGHEVEFLCGKGCQMAAIGEHPDTGTAYDWGDASPLGVPRDELPAVVFNDLIELRRDIAEFFEARGLELDVTGQEGHADESVSDLTPDMVFKTIDYGDKTVAQIIDLLGNKNRSIRTHLTAFRPGSDSGAGIFTLGERGIHLTDFRFGVTHYMAETDDTAAELAAVLPPLPVNHPAAPPPATESVHDRLAVMLETWVHILADNTVRHVDRPFKPIKMSAFDNQHKFKIGNAWALTQWLQAAECQKAGGAAMLPGEGPGIYTMPDGDTVLNTYSPPKHDATGGDVGVFMEFLKHLFPLPGELKLFTEWLACKVQHPDIRMHGLVLVAKKFGTGRGTLFGILKQLFGAAYVTPSVELAHFLGTTKQSQSQYNDFMVNSLLVCVSEARTSGSPTWKEGAEVMERLKERIDTQASDLMIRRKTNANSVDTTYASVIIATQHSDALPIPPDDRRLMVLTNGDPLDLDLAKRLAVWSQDPHNIGALHAHLSTMRYSYEPHGTPPMTQGREIMVREAKSALDLLAEMYIQIAPGAACYLAQFKEFCETNKALVEGTLPQGAYDRAAANALAKYGAEKGDKIKVSAAVGPRLIWVLNPKKVDLLQINASTDTRKTELLRKEIEKNDRLRVTEGLLGLPSSG